ncbi:MAG: hypothetical protein QOJ25_1206 [Solirubrobacteraceae bacterium]|nr:hypothetical protein [Solirubrobacteraceae bacterium]
MLFVSTAPRRRGTPWLRGVMSSSAASVLAVIAALSGTGAAALAADGQRHAVTYMLVLLQTALVAWLGALSWSAERTWARAGVIVTVAWIPTFLISSWIYAVNPSLLDVGPPNGAIATVDLSLVCFIAGYVWPPRRGRVAPEERVAEALAPYVQVRETTLSRRWVIAWIAVGCVGFCAIFAVTGGPIHFIRNVSNEGSLTRGRTYFIAAALALVFLAQAAACSCWARGAALSRWLIAGLAVAFALTATLGARQLLAVPLVELALYYGLVRARVSVRVVVPLVIAAALVLVVGLGMVKRYGNYQQLHPGTHISRLQYLITKGPADFMSSYAGNTADGVRLIALGERTVPSAAPPEYGKEALRLLLQPLPSGMRPAIPTAPAIKAAIYPSSVNSYAQPLQLVSYLQFLYPGVVLAFLVLGAATAKLERALVSTRTWRPSTLLLLVALTTAVTTLLRDADAGAIAVSLIEVVGLWAVARTTERLPEHPDTLARP